jgi:hypothetical protein
MLVLEPIFEADLPPEQYAHRLSVSLESGRMIAVIGAAACEHSRLLPLLPYAPSCRNVVFIEQ